MWRTGSTVVAKALILAAIPVGAAGFFVADPWAVASIVTNVVLLAAGARLWWLDRRWHRLHRSGVPGASVRPDTSYPAGLRVFAQRGPVRYKLMLSATSRVRRTGGRRRSADAPSGDGDRLTMVAHDLNRIQNLIESAQGRARREQLWWLIAGLAASVPIGVAINLATG